MKTKLLVLVILMTMTSNFSFAASLWLNGNDLYSSNGARDYKPGDVITIEVSEQSTARSKATTQTQKQTSSQISTGPQIPLFKGIMKQFVGQNQVDNTFDGQGTTTREGLLTGTVTATVLEVLENGNLLIEGSRAIRVNRETQQMRVRGIARPKDIDANNTINSKLLADAQIKFDGKGAVGRVNRPGIITKIINTVF